MAKRLQKRNGCAARGEANSCRRNVRSAAASNGRHLIDDALVAAQSTVQNAEAASPADTLVEIAAGGGASESYIREGGSSDSLSFNLEEHQQARATEPVATTAGTYPAAAAYPSAYTTSSSYGAAGSFSTGPAFGAGMFPPFAWPAAGAYPMTVAGAYSYPAASTGVYPAASAGYSQAGAYSATAYPFHPGAMAGAYPQAGAYSATATYPGTPAFPPGTPTMTTHMPQAALPAPQMAGLPQASQVPMGLPQPYSMPLPLGAYPVPYPASYAQANYIQNVSPIAAPCLAASQCPATALALGSPQASCPAAGALASGLLGAPGGALSAGPQAATQEPAVQRTLRQSAANALVNVALVVALVLVVAMMFGGASGMPVSIAGYSWATVLTDSMSEVYPRGSLVVAQKVPSDSIRVGDDIMFMAGPDTSCTHRVVEVVTSEGTRAFRTQGTSNPRPDADLVYPENVIGRVIWSSVPVGAVLTIIRDNWPYIVFLLGCVCILKFVISRIYAKDGEAEPVPEPAPAAGPKGPAQASSRNPFSRRKKAASSEAAHAPGGGSAGQAAHSPRAAGGGQAAQAREGPSRSGAYSAPFGTACGNPHGTAAPLGRGPAAGTERGW